MITANTPPIEAVKSCEIENIFETASACGSGKPKYKGIAICTMLMYNTRNFEIAAVINAVT
jgi:hypothetical protein